MKKLNAMKRIVNNSCKLLVITFAGFCSFKNSYAQQGEPKSLRTKSQADIQYNNAGKFKRVLWGEHYRKEWATTVELEVLDFETTAGGLTPIKLGGGMQTKSLRLMGADGKEYVLRSVRKDPTKALPEVFQETFADDIIQDQISSSNPFAPLAVAALANSAHIFNSTPRVYFVPDSKRLGEYASIFANTISLLEERPSGNQENNPSVGYSKNVINSQKLYEKLVSDNHHRVDGRAFLKARLFDMWIGDWDRHEDQWSWAEFQSGDQYSYKPVPRDRDQAFSKLDGFIPQVVTQPWAMRKIKDFDYKVHDIAGLNMSGNPLDRYFLSELMENDWSQTARELQNAFTDAVIETAVRQMPPEIFAVSGEEIIAKLKKRKDAIDLYALEYYKFLSREVNVTGTKKQETFQVNRINNDSTEVIVYNQNDKKNQIIFRRIFLRSETNEIRLYGLDGKDKFCVTGKTTKGIMVRIIGGKGEDAIDDQSEVKGMQHKTKIYDDKENIFQTGSETRKYITSDTLKTTYNRKSFQYDWLGPKQSPGYNPDDGVYVGGGVTFRKQQFGKQPYGYMHSVWGNYAFQTGAYNFWYAGDFKEMIGKWDLHLDAKINAPNFVKNYYGMGNETERLVDDNKYYRVRLNQLFTSASVKRQISAHHFGSGVSFESIKVENSTGRFISDESAKLDSNIFERSYYSSAFINYQYNTLDNPLYPRRGVRLTAGINYTKNLEENKQFLRLSYESSLFFSTGRWTAALRSGIASNVSGEYEFYQANTLGGSENLRGFRRDRFAGKTSVYNNTELRVKLNGYRGYILRGEYGLLSFVDHGRVWIPDEKSTTWHHSYGGGVWLFIYNKIPITATYGISKEDKIVNIKAGFLF